jgi:predicted secreted Zn-dependent protease
MSRLRRKLAARQRSRSSAVMHTTGAFSAADYKTDARAQVAALATTGHAQEALYDSLGALGIARGTRGRLIADRGVFLGKP